MRNSYGTNEPLGISQHLLKIGFALHDNIEEMSQYNGSFGNYFIEK